MVSNKDIGFVHAGQVAKFNFTKYGLHSARTGQAPGRRHLSLDGSAVAGPGTIATLTVFGHTAVADGEIVGLVLGIAAFLVLLAASLFAASFLACYRSPRVTAIAQPLMGLIPASLQASFKAIAG